MDTPYVDVFWVLNFLICVSHRTVCCIASLLTIFQPSEYLLSSLGELFDIGAKSNSVMGYACLRPRAYDLTLRLRPGVKRSTEGENEIWKIKREGL